MTVDIARGLAVLGMVFVHCVPTEGTTSMGGGLATSLAEFLEGKSAVLFCMLAGMSWAIQARRVQATLDFGVYVLRRCCALAAVGLLVHFTVWPTEILLPLACMMPLCLGLGCVGPMAVLSAGLLLLVCAAVLPAFMDFYPDIEGAAGASSSGSHSVVWTVVRHLLFDGVYPLVPWMVFALFGFALMQKGWLAVERTKKWFWTCLIVACGLQVFSAFVNAYDDELGDLSLYLSSTWAPATVPFILLTSCSAMVVIAGLALWQQTLGLPRPFHHIASIGRASLTHYLLHICVVMVPLRRLFPNEDWPVPIGVAAFFAYAVMAWILSVLWFRRFAHGPVEALWKLASGVSRG